MKQLAVIALAAITLATPLAHADRKPSPEPGDPMRKVRELYAKGDYEGVRAELLAQYELDPRPALLFALGQVELNLGNYQAAIDYYERFIATSPAEDQVALAQQAIGAARIRLAEPQPEPPAPTPVVAADTRREIDQPEPERPREKRWTMTHTGLVVFGGAAMLLGGGLLYYSHSLGNDRSGTLAQYDSRLDQARTTRWTGIGVAAAGTLLVGVTVAW